MHNLGEPEATISPRFEAEIEGSNCLYYNHDKGECGTSFSLVRHLSSYHKEKEPCNNSENLGDTSCAWPADEHFMTLIRFAYYHTGHLLLRFKTRLSCHIV